MKKRFLSLLVVSLLAMTTALNAQGLATALTESFELGIPAGWTNTTNRDNGVLWATESGNLTRPQTAAAGSARAYLRNTTGVSIGYTTALVTPALDLSGANNWSLHFQYSLTAKAGFVDELRVYWRSSAEGDWVLLRSYTEQATTWQKVEIPIRKNTYQLKFEGIDHNGWGIVLDEVVVSEENACTVPHDLTVSRLTSTSADLIWVASYDAETYQIVVIEGEALEDITTLNPATALINKTTTVGDFSFTTALTGLTSGKTYTAYVRSNCDEGVVSDWGKLTFKTRVVKDIPYEEDFELARSSKQYIVDGWTHKGNTGYVSPSVPTDYTAAQVTNAGAKHSGNFALSFLGLPVGYNNKTTFLINALGRYAYMQAGEWSYAATPEINADLKECQVRFFASLGLVGFKSDFAKTVAVGVMTDPEDLTTFTAVETLTLWQGPEFSWNEYTVDLSSYTGTGRYVAFLSREDKKNAFFIDDLVIEKPELAKPMKGGISYDAGKLYLTWKASKGATSYNLILGTEQSAAPADLSGKKLILSKVGLTENKLDLSTIEGLQLGGDVFAYIQAVAGDKKTEYYEFHFVAPTVATPPLFFGFEESEGQTERYQSGLEEDMPVPTKITTYANSEWIFPFVDQKQSGPVNEPRTGKYCLTTTIDKDGGMDQMEEAYAVLPAIEKLDTLSMTFYMRAQWDEDSYGKVTVGVMTDPTDISTFEPIATFLDATGKWTRYTVSFSQYKGKGHFIAFYMTDDASRAALKQYNEPVIDDITLGGQPACESPLNLGMSAYTDDNFTLTWDGQNSKYDLIVASKILNDQQLNAGTDASIVASKNGLTVKTLTLSYDEKIEHGKTYYAWVRGECALGTEQNPKSEWSAFATLVLPMPERYELPYEDGFDTYASASVPTGWTRNSITAYPQVNAASKYEEKFGLQINSQLTTSSRQNIGGFISAPLLKIDDLRDVMLTFYAKPAAVQNLTAATVVIDTLYVGTMVNPLDESTFTVIAEIGMPKTEWNQYSVLFDNWTPSMGEYITFTTRHELYNGKAVNNNVYIDNVVFKKYADAQPIDLKISNVIDDKADFAWTAKASQGWQVVVSTDNVKADAMADLIAGNTVVFNQTTNTNNITITGLKPQTHYFAYVKPVAGGAETWNSIEFLSPCLKLDPKNTYYVGFETPSGKFSKGTYYDSYLVGAPDCWTVMMSNPTVADNYVPRFIQYPEGTVTTDGLLAHSGCGAYYLYEQQSVNTYSWLATPEIDGNVGDWTIQFWALPSAAKRDLKIGVMTDPEDYSTFTLLTTITTEKKAWRKYTLNMKEIGYTEGKGQYIVFSTPSTYPVSNTGFYLDDIVLTTSKCKAPELVLSKLTESSVILATALESGTANIIIVKDTILDAEKLNSDASYLATLGTKVVRNNQLTNIVGEQLKDLDAETTYYVAVQGSCGDGTPSPWSVVSFSTLGAPKTPEEFGVVDFENFDGAKRLASTATIGQETNMPGWVRGNISEQGGWPVVFENTGTNANALLAPAGTKALNLYTTTTTNGAYAIMPALKVDDIKKYQMHFKARVNTNSTFVQSTYPPVATWANSVIVGIITDPVDLSTFTALDTLFVDRLGVVEFDVRFSEYKGDLDGNMGKHVMFYSNFTLSNCILVDDIQFSEIPACVEPLRPTAKEVGDDYAVITWKSESEKNRVVVSTEKLETAKLDAYINYAIDSIVEGNSVKLEGLQGNTVYYVYVKSQCENGGIWAEDYASITTACGSAQGLPYIEDFERYTPPTSNNGMKPDCWVTYYNNVTKDNTTKYPNIAKSVNAAHTGEKGLYFYAAKNNYKTAALRATGATPKIEGDISEDMLTFWYRNSGTSAASCNPAMILVGLSTDVSSVAKLNETLVWSDTIRLVTEDGSTWYEYRHDFSDLAGKDYKNMHIVLSALNETIDGVQYYNPTYIDDFKVEKIPTCFTPTDVKISDITAKAATLSFEKYRDADKQWEVALMEDGVFTLNSLGVFDTTTIAIKDLKPLTKYYLYLRTKCADDDLSEYVEAEFTTADFISADRLFDFENDENVVRAPGATSNTYMINRSLTVGNYTDKGETTTSSTLVPYNMDKYQMAGERALQLQNNATYKNAYIVLPEIEKAEEKQVHFFMRAVQDAAETINIEKTAPFAVLEIGTVEAYGDMTKFTALASYKASAYQQGEAVTEAKQKLYDEVVFELPNLDGKQLALRLATPQAYMYIDNLSIEAKAGLTTPKILGQSVISPTTLSFVIDTVGGPKDVYLTDNADIFPLDATKAVKKVEATDKAEVQFDGLTANTQYFAFVAQSGKTDKGAVSARRAYKTPYDLVKIQPDMVIDFEQGLVPMYANDTIHNTIYGMTLGNTMSTSRQRIPYVIANDKDSTNMYSHTGEHALALVKDNDLDYVYAVAPLINSENLDTLQVNFYGRSFKAVKGTAEDNTLSAPYEPLIVGTVTDPNDIETFEELASFTYANTQITYETVATEGDRLFENYSFRLSGAKGKYVTFLVKDKAKWYVDDITVTATSCIAPISLKTLETTEETATLTWQKFDETYTQLQIAEDVQFEKLFKDETLLSDTSKVENLQPGTTYFWRIRQVCGGEQVSQWSPTAQFNTVCKAGTTYETSFEAEDGYLRIIDTDVNSPMRPFCWSVGYEDEKSNDNYYPQVVFSSGSQWYSHDNGTETNVAALYLTSGTAKVTETTYLGKLPERSWAVMPLIDADLDAMEVNFWMSPATYNMRTAEVDNSYYGVTNPNTSSQRYVYARSIIVGTMTDPNDISTFKEIQVVKYDEEGTDSIYRGVAANKDNDFRFKRYSVQLKGAEGKYIAFVSDSRRFQELNPMLQQSLVSWNRIYIDDVEVVPASGCVTPGKRQTTNVTTSSATLSWEGDAEAEYRVTLALDERFRNIVLTDTVQGTSYEVKDLRATEKYFWRVALLCGEGQESAESNVSTFTTEAAPFYYVNISTAVPAGFRAPEGWSSVQMNAKDVFAGKKLPSTQDYANGWGSLQESATGEKYMFVRLSSSTNSGRVEEHYSWLTMPTLQLGEELPARLMFNMQFVYAAIGQVSNDPAQPTGVDDQFMVIISDDGGKTWKQENAVIWNNEDGVDNVIYGKGQYSLNSLSNVKNTELSDFISIDLSQYKGKTIQIAFYAESTQDNARNALKLHDIRVAYYYENVETYEKCLLKEDYEWRDYKVNSTLRGQVEAGEKQFMVEAYAPISRLQTNPTDLMIDTVYTLNATIWESPIDTIEREICAGDEYTDNVFTALTVAGEYTQILESKQGCDSVVVLMLTVNPIEEVLVDTTINWDALPYTYTYNGVEVSDLSYPTSTLPGTYSKQVEIEQGINGCKAIITHTITILPGTSVDNLQGQQLSLTPNFINRGETVRVNGMFTTAQMQGMSIEVYDMTGKRVHIVADPTTLVVDGFYTSGIYSVILTTGTGERFSGRVVVK